MIVKTEKGCLLIHGLTGMPANMAAVAKILEANNYLVKTPMLAGHGGDVKTLAASSWKEWYESLLHAYEALRQECREVYIVGLSMGALLALKLAQDFGSSIKAMALLAVPFHLRPLFGCLVVPGVRYTPLRFFIRSVAKNFEKSVLDPQGREIYRQNGLQRMPARAVFQCQDLQRLVARGLRKVSQPLLLIHGRKDHLANPKGMLEIQKGVSSKEVKIVIMENSAHVLTVDYDRKEVAKKIVAFFGTISETGKGL